MKFRFSSSRLLTALALSCGMFCIGMGAARAEGHLDTVKQRGTLLCGTDNTTPGFGYLNPKTGKMEGMDVDLCRAVAAAVVGDPEKVRFVIVTDKSRFNALRTGQVDVVFAHSTVTTTRESAVGVTFLPVSFYDGTGMLVKTSLKAKHASDLNGATICTTQGSGTEVMWANYIKAHNWKPSTKVLTYQDTDKLFAALNSGRCDVMSTDKSALAGWKGNAPDPAALTILPETLDKSPLAGFTSQDDPRWNAALRWVIYATFEAEEDGITSKNLSTFLKTSNPYISKFLGITGTFGQDLGIRPDFVQKVIASVGNYGEIYDRNLGPKTAYAIEREGSLNALWNKGGLIYSPPWY
ncbi:transporter substrate-binding domain-containing protein [Trinickia acidisoli]|uniref:transporter substrate-binding domain-containing protein n=1 Tax=Trinickia acidisoli TaxID=2767482 RepID=UPI001A8C9F9B|nr:transporter substrate-binding domain-containing protein [Trinickia acidisoli]